MSSLVLVRHAQASFFSENYDQLSDHGRSQSAALGDYWARQGIRFDAVYCGPCARHLETAAEVARVYERHQLHWPPPVVLEALNEHQVDELVTRHSSEIAQRSPTIAKLAAERSQAVTPVQQQATFQRLFEAVASEWQSLPFDDLPVEPWRKFQKRVTESIDQIVHDHRSGRQVVVFTSVGPISVTLQRALELTDAVALRTGWNLRNASLTRFLFSGSRFTLESFNGLPHLDPDAWTYR